MAQAKEMPGTSVRDMLQELLDLARALEPVRLRAALEYLRFLSAEQEDEEWTPDEETREAIRAAMAGETEGFLTHEEVWGAEDDERG